MKTECPFQVGQIVQHVSDGDRGVVVFVVGPDNGSESGVPLCAPGDFVVSINGLTKRVTNIWHEWFIVPPREATPLERLLSYMQSHQCDDDSISGDMLEFALFPNDPAEDRDYVPAWGLLEQFLRQAEANGERWASAQ